MESGLRNVMIGALRWHPAVIRVALATLLLLPLALANPIDPTWMPGIYDNGDCDQLVETLLSFEVTLVASVSVPLVLVGLEVPSGRVAFTSAVLPFDAPAVRAPPLI